MISPYFEELSTKFSNVYFLKVDVDAVEVALKCSSMQLCMLICVYIAPDSDLSLQAVAQECGISAMPTFQVWKNSQKVDELVGSSKEKLQALVEKYA